MAVKRIVDTSFWTDGKVDEFSPEDKYFLLYLLTNPFARQLGIYEISIKQAAFQMGYTVDTFNVMLDRFETKYKMVVFSRETSEIAILNFLRHSIVKGGKPVEDCIRQDMQRVKNRKLIDLVFSRLHGRDDLNVTVKKIVDAYINENGIDNDNGNDNDNENDSTGHESLNDSLSTPPTRAHGRYQNVVLTEEEYQALRDDIPNADEVIENLSMYIKSTGRHYESHEATIRKWAKEDAEKQSTKQDTQQNQSSGNVFYDIAKGGI